MLPKKISDEECRDNAEKNSADYNEEAFLHKAMRFAGVIGREALLKAFQLYYVTQKPELPAKVKTIIMGALAYLVLPVDVVPDLLPVVGYTDDVAVLAYALLQALPYIDDEVNARRSRWCRKFLARKNRYK